MQDFRYLTRILYVISGILEDLVEFSLRLMSIGRVYTRTCSGLRPLWVSLHQPLVELQKTAPSTSTTVKLPRVKLKAFTGDLTQWTPFWESFEAAVHTNTHLTPVEKFNYLNSVVVAQEAIAGLSLTAANYEQAITTLKKRFENKQIINKHMD